MACTQIPIESLSPDASEGRILEEALGAEMEALGMTQTADPKPEPEPEPEPLEDEVDPEKQYRAGILDSALACRLMRTRGGKSVLVVEWITNNEEVSGSWP